MNLIIDGHNLIPKVPGLSLQQLDDEPHLTELIQEYCRLKRCTAELFFDGGLPGFASPSSGGLVHVHVIQKNSTADEAMLAFLSRKGKAAHSYTLVSSDLHVQVQARSLGAAILSSDQFARELTAMLSRADKSEHMEDKPLSPAEVDEWLKLFNSKKN